ncbi:MAG: hypothetical protein EOO15_03965 [Chitinophagaceae bacterium]|nr:MAG: hypothetical protein EOO15_03965 [Chitinophagaceae bacterium]
MKRWNGRVQSTCVVAMIWASSTALAQVQAGPSVQKELAKIPTTTQSNVLIRLSNCRIKLTSNSWVETVTTNSPQRGLLAGDTVIWAEIDVPPPIGADEVKRKEMKSLSAGWVKRATQFMPTTGWAKALQQHPAPLWWLNC